IDWKLNQKTSTRLNLNRAFQPSPQDQSILSTSLGLALNHRLNEKMNAEIHASWSKSAYTKALTSDRNMDMFTIGAFLRKNLSQHFDVGGGYDFSTASQSVGGDFDRHILYVDVNGRY
ncbi:MAG: outer membrane beta-barrel protein, partial [Opitutales bacterium]